MAYDVVGDIAILNLSDKVKAKEKKKIAETLLKQKSIKTVLEKVEKVKGRLRTIKVRHLAGVRTSETLHTESGCRFKVDVEKTYFSPRLSGDRLEVAKEIKKKDRVLVMFSGVGPYPIVIAKKSKPREIVAIDLSRLANKYAEENVLLNKIDNIELIQGDVRKVIPEMVRKKRKFDKIVMAPLNLKTSFFPYALKVAKRGSEIFYYGFGEDVGKIIERVYEESKKARKKIIVLKVKKAGEIAPYKYRWRIKVGVC
jgi:tRNA (guanine37-N1)-methyltransferase